MQHVKLNPQELVNLDRWVEDNLGEIMPLDWYNPPSLELLQRDRDHAAVHVFEGGAPVQQTIFYNGVDPLDRRYMHAYRAWHDTLHLRYGLALGGDEELELAKIQEHVAVNELGFSDFGAMLLRLDLELHIKHYDKWKSHPEQQVLMIECALQYGQEFALRKEWL